MNTISRHIACKLCRDRKVRCDGGQPTCEKCRRSGETCVYVPTHKPTKADLAQTIETLQERLDKAEAYIQRHCISNKVPNPIGQYEQHQQPTTSLPMATPASVMGTDFPDYSVFDLQMAAAMTTTGDHPFLSTSAMTPTPFSQHSLPISPELSTLDGEFMNFLPGSQQHHQHIATSQHQHQHQHHFQMEDLRGGGGGIGLGGVSRMDSISGHSTSATSTASSYRRDSVYSHGPMPSVREVRVLDNSSTCTTPPPMPSPGGSRGSTAYGHSSGYGRAPDDANHILAELTAFGMTVFNTQAEIAGISSVVAEYLNWMRRTASTSSSSAPSPIDSRHHNIPNSNNGNNENNDNTDKATINPALLEALETRLRELNAMASSRHADAWRQSVRRLERLPGVGAMLSLFDNEMQRRSSETAEFFHTNGYDVFSSLPEQLGRKD